jgi:hypothetical protein
VYERYHVAKEEDQRAAGGIPAQIPPNGAGDGSRRYVKWLEKRACGAALANPCDGEILAKL